MWRLVHRARAQGFFGPIVPNCSPTTGGSNPCSSEDFIQLAINIIQFLIDVTLVLAVVAVLVGGILLLTSGGSVSQIERGKGAIKGAVIGIVIVLASVLVINTFLRVFTTCGPDPNQIGIININSCGTAGSPASEAYQQCYDECRGNNEPISVCDESCRYLR